MRNQPCLPVECDNCGETIEITLTTTVRGYDERNVDYDLMGAGWSIINIGTIDYDYCSDDCVKKAAETQMSKIPLADITSK